MMLIYFITFFILAYIFGLFVDNKLNAVHTITGVSFIWLFAAGPIALLGFAGMLVCYFLGRKKAKTGINFHWRRASR
ncbi:hypothetical protein JCM19231_3323 [Vibrio ishigakensis]|uniref:Uncharacterized protein n=1 Tax=Vibrio ishigakensis TaxID=1481914 RepID=A0A0B8NV76_9VIBR|nr:hypothetical protein [Vibrio ishigakensis]GAM57826.1 hypothetical protein JCM19231_3323 [Vibrio ishigakensis]